MDKRTKEYRDNVDVNPDLVFIRQLDRMLEEFMWQRDYSEFFSEASTSLPSDVEVIRECQRRIHYIRLSVAFKENRERREAAEIEAEETDSGVGAPTGPEKITAGAQQALGLPGASA